MKRVRFNLTDEQYERLQRLARRMGVTPEEALRFVLEVHVSRKRAEQQEKEQPVAGEGREAETPFMEVLG